MIICAICGNDNDFGRVFCTKCGTKLDLSHMNSAKIVDIGKKSLIMSYWPVAVTVLVLIVVAAAVLAFWGQKDVLGESGGRSDSRIIKNQIVLFNRLAKGQSMGATFTEKNINSYSGAYLIQPLKLESCSVDIQSGVMNMRVVRKYGPYGMGTFRKEIRISTDVAYKADGGNLVAQSGAIGHLPMPGPLASLPHRMVAGLFGKSDDMKSFEFLKEIVFEEGHVKLQFER